MSIHESFPPEGEMEDHSDHSEMVLAGDVVNHPSSAVYDGFKGGPSDKAYDYNIGRKKDPKVIPILPKLMPKE